MGYVLMGIIVLFLVGGFITYLVLQATRRSSPAAERDHASGAGDDGGAPGAGADRTPLGDTAEHAGEQTEAGETVGGQDAEHAGGTGAPQDDQASHAGEGEPVSPEPDRRFQRDPVGGEAEARPFTPDDR